MNTPDKYLEDLNEWAKGKDLGMYHECFLDGKQEIRVGDKYQVVGIGGTMLPRIDTVKFERVNGVIQISLPTQIKKITE